MWDIGHLLRASVLRFLRARNLQGFDIYLLPYAEHRNAGYILLDLDHAGKFLVSRAFTRNTSKPASSRMSNTAIQ